MCGRTCVGVTSGKKARTHALRTLVSEVISHAHAHVRPHIARVRARTHLRNPYLADYRLDLQRFSLPTYLAIDDDRTVDVVTQESGAKVVEILF